MSSITDKLKCSLLEIQMNYPLAIGDYKKLRNSKAIFVDKTLMIQELLSDTTEAFLIARPRRFGKTINMSMIKYFFDIRGAAENRKLYEDTKIATANYTIGTETKPCMDEQGKHPVIFITLKGLRTTAYEKMMNHLRVMMATLYEEHRYLLEGKTLTDDEKVTYKSITGGHCNDSKLAFSLKALTKYVHDYYDQPVILLVDEYDTPMHTAYSQREPFHEELSTFMSTFLGEAFKDNPSLKQGILTGILRVALMNLFSGFNSVVVRSILSKQYSQHFGFTEEEVSGLFAKLNRQNDEAKVKAWYNGYIFGETTVYNPWSIVCCLENKDEFESYWIETGYHGVLGKALISSADLDVFDKLQALLAGKTINVVIDQRTIFASINNNQMALWSLMLFSGYLKLVRTWSEDDKKHAELAIPNLEVRLGIESMVESWTSNSEEQSVNVNSELVKSLMNGDTEGFKEIIQNYISQTISYYDFSFKTAERFYHIFMLGMLIGLHKQFIIDSNKEAGLGRYDIILIPRNARQSGVVIELKRVKVTSEQKYALKNDELMRIRLMGKEAKAALEQIETKQYAVRFAQHNVKKFMAVGMAFLGKEFAVLSESVDVQ